MTFSNGFSDSFNKQATSQPTEPSNIGEVTSQFHSTFGTRNIGSFTQEFNIVMRDWKIGDYPP